MGTKTEKVEMTPDMKVCARCGKTLPLSKFRCIAPYAGAKAYYRRQCEACEVISSREWYLEHKKKMKRIEQNEEDIEEIRRLNVALRKATELDEIREIVRKISLINTNEEFEKVMKRKNHKGFEKDLVDSNERIHTIPYVLGGKI